MVIRVRLDPAREQEKEMPHVRIATLRIVDPTRLPEQRRFTEEEFLPALRRLPGFRRYLGIVDDEARLGIAITEWDERAQAEGMREARGALARQIDEMGIVRFVGAQVYEVVSQVDADTPAGR